MSNNVYSRFKFVYIIGRITGLFPFGMIYSKTKHVYTSTSISLICFVVHSGLFIFTFTLHSFYCKNQTLSNTMAVIKILIRHIIIGSLYFSSYIYGEIYLEVMKEISKKDNYFKSVCKSNLCIKYIIFKFILILWQTGLTIVSYILFNYKNRTTFCALYFTVPLLIEYSSDILCIFLFIEISTKFLNITKIVKIRRLKFENILQVLHICYPLKGAYINSLKVAQIPFLVKIIWIFIATIGSADFFFNINYSALTLWEVLVTTHPYLVWMTAAVIDFCLFLICLQKLYTQVKIIP